MTDPLQQFTAAVHPLGNELILRWILPDELPASYRVYIFRKTGSAVTETEIDNYFAGSTPTGVTVFSSLDSSALRYFDLDLENSSNYYYSALVRDLTGEENSTVLQTNGTPAFSATTTTIDTKTLVVNGIKRILSNYSAKDVRDYEIRKSYSLANVKPPLIAVVRQSANDIQRVWGSLLQDTNDEQRFGKYEQESILVTWEDISSDRRDNLTKLVRVNEKVLETYIIEQEPDIIQVFIQMGGDGVDPRWENLEMHTGQMIILIVFPSSINYADQQQRLPYHDVSHAGEFN